MARCLVLYLLDLDDFTRFKDLKRIAQFHIGFEFNDLLDRAIFRLFVFEDQLSGAFADLKPVSIHCRCEHAHAHSDNECLPV